MIRNGYYYPIEMYRDLRRIDNGEIKGNAQMGICFGNRTGGKTVGHAIQMIKNFEDRHETCMLLSRTLTQKDDGYLEKWWRNKIFVVEDQDGIIQDFVKNHKIEFSKNSCTVDGEPFSYCESISMSHKVKDEGAYRKCSTIIMDECVQKGERVLIIDKRSAMERIFEIMQTAARGWEGALNAINIVFIANVSNRDNWLFNDLRINDFVRDDTKYTCQNGIVVEIVMNEAAKSAIDNSLIGQIMRRSVSGQEYYEAAQGNQYLDNKSFIEKKGLDFSKLIVQLVMKNYCLGVFFIDGKYHIAVIRRDKRARAVTNEIECHSDDVELELFEGWGRGLSEKYENGKCTFQTLEAKGLFFEYMKYM